MGLASMHNYTIIAPLVLVRTQLIWYTRSWKVRSQRLRVEVEEKLKAVPAAQGEGRGGVTLRAILIGLVLVAVVCFVVSYTELVLGTIQIGFLQMPPAAIGIFFFLVLLNSQIRKLGQRFALRAGEMLMIYCMMIVAAMISSRGIMEKIIPILVTPNYFANTGNRWTEVFFPFIKRWLVPFDPNGGAQQPLAKGFFEGLRGGEPIPWADWALPLAVWGLLVLLVIFAFLCLASILRRQWVDNEKLSFPLVQPPLELVYEQGASILKNRALWGGVALPFVVFSINGVHNWYPAVPMINLQYFINPLLTNPPWDSMYYTCLFISFAAIGFFFLLPSDVLFSVWFFAIFARLQGVVAASYNMDLPRMHVYGTHLFVAYQTAGAYFVLVAYLFYVSLPHLRRVARAAFGGEKVDDSQELLPYSFATKGLILSFLLILGWCWMAGMSAWVAALEFGVFLFVIALVMARSTAEAGMLMTETSFRPIDLYRMFAAPNTLGAANLTLLAFFDVAFLRDQRGLLFTGILDGLKMSDGGRVRRRSFLSVFVIAILAAMLIAGAIHMWIPYKYGGITLYPTYYNGLNLQPFADHAADIAEARPPTWQAPFFFVVGVMVTALLAYMRYAFFWWPLHPLGYALCVSWTVSVFWFSALIAWILKTLVLRYGGMRLYVKARPWFLGMVLGEFASAVIWALLGALTGSPPPTYPWP